MKLDDAIDLALRKNDELIQEAHVLSMQQPYEWLNDRARLRRKAAAYRQFVRTAEELKKLL